MHFPDSLTTRYQALC